MYREHCSSLSPLLQTAPGLDAAVAVAPLNCFTFTHTQQQPVYEKIKTRDRQRRHAITPSTFSPIVVYNKRVGRSILVKYNVFFSPSSSMKNLQFKIMERNLRRLLSFKMEI